MYRKSIIAKRKEAKAKRCAQMRAAKERKRIALSTSLKDVGGFVTDGCLGNHVVRFMAFPDGERLAVVIDWNHRKFRTYRGVLRCIAKMVINRMDK